MDVRRTMAASLMGATGAAGVGTFVDLFSVVELEAGSRCNRTCRYCPVSLNPRPDVPVKMPEPVFDALVEQLADLDFAGRISYHFYNEPLLRKDFDRLVSVIDARLPSALQVLYTNGDLLDDKRFDQLRAAGIDYFIVTRHSGGDYRERPFQIVQRSHNLVLTNRGGTLIELAAPTPVHRRQPCFAPSEMLIVTVTGDVVLCYEDAHRTHVMGNVLRQHVADIWRSPRFVDLRQELAGGNRSANAMCAQCTNVAHTRPGLSQVEEPFLNATTEATTAVAELKLASVHARRAPGAELERCVAAAAGGAAVGRPVRLDGDGSLVYRQDTVGGPVVVRLTPAGRRSRAELAAELRWQAHLADRGVPVARPRTVDPVGPYQAHRVEYHASLFELVEGERLTPAELDGPLLEAWGALLRGLYEGGAGSAVAGRPSWRDSLDRDLESLDPTPPQRAAVEVMLDRADATGPARLAHADLGLHNVLRTAQGLVAVDFEDSCVAPVGYDMAVVLYDLLVGQGGKLRLPPADIVGALRDGYGPVAPFPRRPLFEAIVVARAIRPRRLGARDVAADRALRDLIESGRLPHALDVVALN